MRSPRSGSMVRSSAKGVLAVIYARLFIWANPARSLVQANLASITPKPSASRGQPVRIGCTHLRTVAGQGWIGA